MKKIRFTIAYDGTEYSGWQIQNHARTIQGDIEEQLTRICQEKISLHGAGRTDAGVHAEGMTAHFECNSRLSPEDFQRALNSMLPGAIRILQASYATPEFHSRFNAKGKVYIYTLYTGKIMPIDKRLYMLHQPKPLDHEKINSCLDLLLGTHDFSSFENSGSRDKSYTCGRGAVRTLSKARFDQVEENICTFTFIGDGFLKNMVRNIVGSALEVGRDHKTVEWFEQALKAKDRRAAGPTAPPHGLKLSKVLY